MAISTSWSMAKTGSCMSVRCGPVTCALASAWATCWAAKAVLLREPLKPTRPALDQPSTLPCMSVMVTLVLLNVAKMLAMPTAIFLAPLALMIFLALASSASNSAAVGAAALWLASDSFYVVNETQEVLLVRQGLPIGVFTELEPKGPASVYVLIPYPTVHSFATAAAGLNADAEYQQAGAAYLQTPKSNPGFERIDSWLMLAFAGQPKISLAPYSLEKKPRVFEMRTYQSHSELKALKKVEMFNSGEIDVMHEVGLAPVFYGQVLLGKNAGDTVEYKAPGGILRVAIVAVDQ